MDWSLLAAYFLRITPGFLLGFALLLALKRRALEWRIAVYICLFILGRDAMTPLGLWQFNTSPNLWIRFPSPYTILPLGFLSVLLVAAIQVLEPDLARLVIWKKRGTPGLVAGGLLGGLAIALPSLALQSGVPIAERGGLVAASAMIPVLLFSLLGNFLEEALFRGYLQGYFEARTKTPRAILLSALFFAFGNIFLAATVTDSGPALLLFTFYEGLVCAFLCSRWGLLSAALAHGIGIWLLTAGFQGGLFQ